MTCLYHQVRQNFGKHYLKMIYNFIVNIFIMHGIIQIDNLLLIGLSLPSGLAQCVE